jgi:membrane carboxypeptidase/penicillin-binding protein PbpC
VTPSTDRVLRGALRRRHLTLIAAVAVAALLAGAFAAIWMSTPSVTDLGRRVSARLRIAPVLAQATVATEDERFYSHSGVDVVGLLRAIPYDLSHLSLAQGGSTITEQLAKNVYLGGEDRSPYAKARDVALAIRLEARYSKHQILAAYLASAYFGHGADGIAAASRRYFARTPAHLTLGQASLLAGLIQAPSALDPYRYPARARARQVDVLRGMVRNHFITSAQGVAVLRRPLRLAGGSSLPALAGHISLSPGPAFDVAELALGFALIAAASLVLFALHRRAPCAARAVRAFTLLVFLLGLWATIRSFRVA